MAVSDRVTNQVLLDAIFLTAQESGSNRFDIIARADLWDLFYDRAVPYGGVPVTALPGLSDDEKRALQRKLFESLARRQNAVAITLGPLNLRAGPGVQFDMGASLKIDGK